MTLSEDIVSQRIFRRRTVGVNCRALVSISTALELHGNVNEKSLDIDHSVALELGAYKYL